MLAASDTAARRHSVGVSFLSRFCSISSRSSPSARDKRPRATATWRHTSDSRSASSSRQAVCTAGSWNARKLPASPCDTRRAHSRAARSSSRAASLREGSEPVAGSYSHSRRRSGREISASASRSTDTRAADRLLERERDARADRRAGQGALRLRRERGREHDEGLGVALVHAQEHLAAQLAPLGSHRDRGRELVHRRRGRRARQPVEVVDEVARERGAHRLEQEPRIDALERHRLLLERGARERGHALPPQRTALLLAADLRQLRERAQVPCDGRHRH